MKRQTALVHVAKVVLFCAAICAMGACDRLPNPHERDALGEIPRFHWIAKGQPRPTPSTARAVVGFEPLGVLARAPEGRRSVGTHGRSTCRETTEVAACVRRNWTYVLRMLGEAELAAPVGHRAYRYLVFPACGDWSSATLHVSSDGTGVLEIGAVDADVVRKIRHVDQLSASHPSRERLDVPSDKVRAFERAFAWSGFTRVVADPRSLWMRKRCFDGQEVVFEAYVRDRYRYVRRHSCDVDFKAVRAWGERLLALDNGRRPRPVRGC